MNYARPINGAKLGLSIKLLAPVLYGVIDVVIAKKGTTLHNADEIARLEAERALLQATIEWRRRSRANNSPLTEGGENP